MSKRASDLDVASCKRKHYFLSLKMKVELLKKMKYGTSIDKLYKEYGIRKSVWSAKDEKNF